MHRISGFAPNPLNQNMKFDCQMIFMNSKDLEHWSKGQGFLIGVHLLSHKALGKFSHINFQYILSLTVNQNHNQLVWKVKLYSQI